MGVSCGEWERECGLGASGEGSAVIKDDGGDSELYVDVTEEILWTYRSVGRGCSERLIPTPWM